MPAVIRFDAVIVVVLIIVVIQGLDILCCGHRHLSRCTVASLVLVAPLPLSPRRHHIATPTPVSLRLSRTSGWLLHRHLSRRASASLVVPAPLLLRHHLSCCADASLVVPHFRRLVVASSTILTCHRLSCLAGWLSPYYLSLCATVSLFATSLIALQSLWVIDPQPQ